MAVIDRDTDTMTHSSTVPKFLQGRRWRRFRTDQGRYGHACVTDSGSGFGYVFTHERAYTETNEFGELVEVRLTHWEWAERLPRGERIKSYLDWAAPPKPGRKATFLHTS